MRLLRAELTKLRRPLTWWVLAAAVLASVAFAWQGAKNASAAAQTPTAAPVAPTCGDFALPEGPLCDRAVAVQQQIDAYHRRQAASRPSTRHNARPSDALPVEQPLAAGKIAVGFMASLGGALLILLLGAAHLAGEWDNRTIKTVLCQQPRRSRVLAAKAASTWIAAMMVLLVDWVVLAAISPVLKSAYPLPGPGLTWSAAWNAVAADTVRAPLVLAVFTVLGLAAAIVVRNALGAFALAATAVVASLAAAGNFPTIAPWTLPYWVSGWMQFRSHGYVIYHFWVDGYPHAVGPPTVATGVLGLLALTAVLVAVAQRLVRRLDIDV